MIPFTRSRRTRRLGILTAATLALLLGAGGTVALAQTSSNPTTIAPAAGGEPISPNIIGGHDATRPYPSTASLQTNFAGDPDFAFCGATVIADRWAVTNAHCVTNDDATPTTMALHLRVGSPDRTSGGIVVQVAQVLPHASWDWGTDNGSGRDIVADIALLRLASPVPGRHIDIPTRLGPPAAPTVIVGWGLTTPDGTSLPIQLQELDTQLLPARACANEAVNITAGEICVNSPHHSAGSCNGDSGTGAMQMATAHHFQLIGGASRGAADTCAIRPTIYTNHVFFRGWVQTVQRTGQVPPPARGQEPTRPQPPVGTAALMWGLPSGWPATTPN